MVDQTKRHPINILLADDDSEHIRVALALLQDIPFPEGTFVTVFRTYCSTQAADLDHLKDTLHQTCELLRKKGLHAESELLLGSPAEKLTEYAKEHKPDLIVIGAKGLRGRFGIFFGGIPHQVIEHACCPVLVVRTPYKQLWRILLVMDNSPYNQQAIQYLSKLPLPKNASLQVMYVLPLAPLPEVILGTPHVGAFIAEPPLTSDVTVNRRAIEEMEGQALLDQIVKSLQTYGLTASSVLKRGDAVPQIIEYAKDQKIDLIVTASCGRGQVRSWLMGSITRELVHYAGCSVLVIKNPRST
jgi:nucleotide-binding universal stress UspA family protein